MTKKEFNKMMAIGIPIVTVLILVAFVAITNRCNEELRRHSVTDEERLELEQWKKISNITRGQVSEGLWATAGNEALLLSNTVEPDTVMAVYANYYTESGMRSGVVTAGTLDFDNTVVAEREIAKLKFQHKLASSSVVSYYEGEEIEVSGVILSWQRQVEGEEIVYSLIDMNADGSWDYVAKGKESAFFDDTAGIITYTDDVGNATYANAENYIEVVSPHVNCKEAEKLLN